VPARQGTPNREEALAEAVTTAVAETPDRRRERIHLLIEEPDRENWATGGELHADKFRSRLR